MPSAETVLDKDIAPGESVTIAVPALRPGDINESTGNITIGGFVQPATFTANFHTKEVVAQNDGTDPWSSGARAVISWQGLIIEDRVEAHDWQLQGHEARISALENQIGKKGKK